MPIAEGGNIELLEPIAPQSNGARFLERQGEGIHHICFEVDNIDKELSTLADKGAQLIDKQGQPGLAGKFGFIHPKSVRGVLLELYQETRT